uniref:Peptidase C1A papain C-terminal domain-containing protein n=1 Tax=Fibrocapsa japonica TaxID=94617 RepID=A0A7S2V0K1_9STRA
MPTSFDWVSQGAVTPVRNQGVCGDCWSFSTSDCTAGAWFMAGNDLVQLSAQELTSCDEYSFGCDGGFFGSTFDWIIENGILSEEEYPQSWETVYQGKTLMCKNDLLEGAQFKAGLDSWSSVSPTLDSEEELQLALLRNGPLSIGVDATSMEFYTGGVDQGIGCTGSVDHAIVLVGWGVENGEKYWLVKNSWGDIWGEDGYWKVVFGQDACNLADWVYSTYKSS